MSSSLLNSEPRRRFTLRDMLALIVATAFGLAWTRAAWDDIALYDTYPYRHTGTELIPLSFIAPLNPVMWWIRQTCPFFVPITFAVLCLRLVGPGRALHRLTRQPGSVACAAVCAAVTFQVSAQWLERLAYVVFIRRHGRLIILDNFSPLRLTADLACASVASTWILLRVSGRWKQERDWVERPGIALAIYWLAVSPLSWLIDLLDVVLR